ncbi:MAG: hypothetical protein HZA52_01275 [Planctomycetes bacterium]|nr:hypothetical protein [Planctomycetota bacterium]
MDLKRLLIALLCLPALLAPSGFSAVLCLCGDMAPVVETASCCAVQQVSCCCETPSDDSSPVEAHAPCKGCRDLSTPRAPATRTPTGADELAHAALLPLPASFSFVRADDSLGSRPTCRVARSHAPPLASAIPLRI